jgi:hypothetical protein
VRNTRFDEVRIAAACAELNVKMLSDATKRPAQQKAGAA